MPAPETARGIKSLKPHIFSLVLNVLIRRYGRYHGGYYGYDNRNNDN